MEHSKTLTGVDHATRMSLRLFQTS